jgi:hypothetical protein
LSIAVVSVPTPSCKGLTFVRASSEDLSAATSAQASAGVALVCAEVAGAAVVSGGLVELGVELGLQLARMLSRTVTATAPDRDRRARPNRIWVLSPSKQRISARYTRDPGRTLRPLGKTKIRY